MRRLFHSAAASFAALGCAAMSVASCTEAECADLGTCAAEAPADAGADAARPRRDATSDDAPPPATNPYGKDYPTENLGWTPRKRGSTTPGSVIPNVVFETAIGSRLARPASPALQSASLQLADLFDPERKKHDAIVLVLATAWETGSKQFLEGLGRTPDRTIVLSVLGEGAPTGDPPTMQQFTSWAHEYYWAWNALDGGFTRLSELQKRAPTTTPIVVLIDTTTMELASFNAGGLSAAALDAEIQAIRLRQ